MKNACITRFERQRLQKLRLQSGVDIVDENRRLVLIRIKYQT